MDKVDKQRSIRIIERKLDTVLGTITYTVQVDDDLFKYKSKEEIAEMIERQLHNDTLKYVLDDIANTEQVFKLTKRREKMTNEVAKEIMKQFRDRQGNSSDDVEAFNLAIKALEIELLTDTEQRIFLTAMHRERKVCRMVDDTCTVYDNNSSVSLVEVCDSIVRKVKKIKER